LNFTGLEGFPGNQKKTEKLKSRKFETGVTKKAGWFRVAAFLAGPWIRGTAVEAREKQIEFLRMRSLFFLD